jgi:hypothetical protein
MIQQKRRFKTGLQGRMSQTRKRKRVTPSLLRYKLTVKEYDKYLDKHVYHGEDPFKLPADDEWDPTTGTCAMHCLFTIEALGFRLTDAIKEYRGFKEVVSSNIETILKKLNSGYMIEFLHAYREKSLVNTLPRNNLYDSHDFIVVKGGDRYFLSQGFQFQYKHSLKSYTEKQIRRMLHDILTYLCDYDTTKRWKDLDLSYYTHYFKADLLLGKLDQLKVDPEKKVNGVVLEYCEIKPR